LLKDFVRVLREKAELTCCAEFTGVAAAKLYVHGGPKTDTQFNFWDYFGNSAPTLTILSPLQAAIYGT